MARAFEGLRVVDATHVLAGPFAAYQFAVLGADVVRIDRPDEPDQSRSQGPDRALNAAGMGTAYLAQGANKRSVALDLKTPEGRDALYALLRNADVFIQNFRPGALARQELDYETVARINPRLVYCSISAFGQDGPRATETGYDNVFQAMSGLMAMTGTEKSGPLRAGSPVVDYATGYMAAFAITAALYRREKEGCGAHVDLAMFDAALMLMSAPIAALTAGGLAPVRQGNRFPIAGLGAYPTADGLLMIGAANPGQQRRLWEVIGRPDLAKRTYDESRDDFERETAVLHEAFLGRPSAEWEELLKHARIPVARVRSLEEALGDEQLDARGVLQSVDCETHAEGKFMASVAPFLMTGGDPCVDMPPPRLGEHTVEILLEAGIDRGRIEAMLSSGIAK